MNLTVLVRSFLASKSWMDSTRKRKVTISHGGIKNRGRREARDGLFSYRPKIMLVLFDNERSTLLRLKDEFLARIAPRRTTFCSCCLLLRRTLSMDPRTLTLPSHHFRSFCCWGWDWRKKTKPCLLCLSHKKKNLRTDQQTHWPMPIFLFSISTLSTESGWLSHLLRLCWTTATIETRHQSIIASAYLIRKVIH